MLSTLVPRMCVERAMEAEGLRMNDRELSYFVEEDVLHLVVSDDHESKIIEISPNVTAELNDKDELIGIEIIGATSFLQDSILESIRAR